VSHEKRRRRYIRELQTGRFLGEAGLSVSGRIDEDDLPLSVRETLQRLRQELGQLNEALAQRNLDLLEARRELRILHRARTGVDLVQNEHAACQRANRLARRGQDLERGPDEAVDRLNGFLSAYEGAPEPSENDTKHLVVRLIGLRQNAETP